MFTSPLGKHQFHVLQNMPAMFQELLEQMFDGTISYVVRYIDDLVVYSMTWKEHLKRKGAGAIYFHEEVCRYNLR